MSEQQGDESKEQENGYLPNESIDTLREPEDPFSGIEQSVEFLDDEEHNHGGKHITELREQDRWLPINNVARLMKNTLPVSAKVSKDAKECMQECVSEFISFVTSEASDRCAADKRKTINGEDILISLHALGFENYAEVLKIYLAKYRQYQALRNQQMFEEEERERERASAEQDSANINLDDIQEAVLKDETSSNVPPE